MITIDKGVLKSRIRLFAETMKISQSALSVELGVSRQQINNIMSLKKDILPSLEIVYRFCKTYSVSSDWVLGISDELPDLMKKARLSEIERLTDELSKLEEMIRMLKEEK